MQKFVSKKCFSKNIFKDKALKSLKLGQSSYNYYDISAVGSNICIFVL